MTVVHVVVPANIDDPRRPSGGNVYDRRVLKELAGLGWSVREHGVPGSWPMPTSTDLAALGTVLGGIPDGAVVLADGLVASVAAEVLVPEAPRLRLVVLVHMPLTDAPPGARVADAQQREGAVLSGAVAVVTTSEWARRRLLERLPLPPERVHVAEPGVDPADVAPGTATGAELLCVAAVTPHKGHDLLLTALARLPALSWRCTCVGALDRDPEYADRLHKQAVRDDIADRVRFTGPLTGTALGAEYAGADVLVLASRGETYAMVATEALARGLPVVATAVGGLPEALGHSLDGSVPGLLVPPDDPRALAAALADWLTDVGLRRRLRTAATERRRLLPPWGHTADRIAHVLTGVA